MWKIIRRLLPAISILGVLGILAAAVSVPLGQLSMASSHREAPLISTDPQADATDVYAFVSPDRPDTVTIMANYYPFQTSYGGPNFHGFGDGEDAIYRIYVDNVGDGQPHLAYHFNFWTETRNPNTFLYNTGPITSLDDPDWNVRQRYGVTWFDPQRQSETLKVLANGLIVPPPNIGPKSTPNYDALAASAVYDLPGGAKVFVGPRDDPFFVDLGSIFDLLTIRKLPGDQGGGVDGLAGYNVFTIALQIPINQLTKDGRMVTDPKDPSSVIGVWTSSLRRSTTVLKGGGEEPQSAGHWVQVSRLGMPLVNEVVIPRGMKDRFNNSLPIDDGQFLSYVVDPEPARLLNALYGIKIPPTPRDDLVAIFLTGIPGVNMPPGVTPSEQLRLNVAIKPGATANRLGVVAGDAAGFPNGRRLADDVTDIALKAVAGAAYPLFHPGYQPDALAGRLGDGVDANDKPFMSKFPYAASPDSGLE